MNANDNFRSLRLAGWRTDPPCLQLLDSNLLRWVHDQNSIRSRQHGSMGRPLAVGRRLGSQLGCLPVIRTSCLFGQLAPLSAFATCTSFGEGRRRRAAGSIRLNDDGAGAGTRCFAAGSAWGLFRTSRLSTRHTEDEDKGEEKEGNGGFLRGNDDHDDVVDRVHWYNLVVVLLEEARAVVQYSKVFLLNASCRIAWPVVFGRQAICFLWVPSVISRLFHLSSGQSWSEGIICRWTQETFHRQTENWLSLDNGKLCPGCFPVTFPGARTSESYQSTVVATFST